MRILHLLNTMAPSESTWHILNMYPQTEHFGDALSVCNLSRDTDCATVLRQAGVQVNSLGWSRWFDPRAMWSLRRHLDAINPDVIHVWDHFTLRVLALVNRQRLSRVVFTCDRDSRETLNWLDRRLTDSVRTWSPWEAVCVSAAARPMPAPTHNEVAAGDQVSQPFRIVCAGWNDHAAGFRSAIWAFDFLRHYYLNLHLDLVGVEDASGSLQRLATGLEVTDRVRFHPPTLHLHDALANADIVWMPSARNCGAEIAWEALRLGKPVVASDVPCLRRLLGDELLDCLVSVGDVTSLTRTTHRILRSPELRAHLAITGQESAGRIDTHWRSAYEPEA